MSVVPDEGKSGNISDIQKEGRTDPGNYRPVSLKSSICKVQEKHQEEPIQPYAKK